MDQLQNYFYLKLKKYRWSRQWTCLNCGFIIWNEIPFCLHCQDYLKNRIATNQSRTIKSVPIKSIFVWNPSESDSLSNLVLYLKNQPIEAWYPWAGIAIQSGLGPGRAFPTFIPCPSRNPKRQHARHFAQALAQKTGGSMLEIFEYISTDATKSQEQKTLRGRKGASKMRIHSWDAIKTATTPLIFVDDVVTSGATVESAIQTLKPFHFDRVICLANRGKLAQESLF